MPSSELTELIVRNGRFLTVYRAGYGSRASAPNEESGCGLHSAITGEFIMGIGGGTLPEYSRYLSPDYGCACTPQAYCRTGAHGTSLQRGWRNILYELVARSRIWRSREIRTVLGEEDSRRAVDYGMKLVPGTRPDPAWEYESLRSP